MAEIVTVGVLADTHGRFFDALRIALAECDHIIHAGDIGSPTILRSLEALAPISAVLGNNDFNEYGSHVQRFSKPIIGGVRFLVAHYPEDIQLKENARRVLAPGEPLPQICIHGHTHIPYIKSGKDIRPADMVMCPGSPVYPRGGSKPSIIKIEISEKRVLQAFIEEV